MKLYEEQSEMSITKVFVDLNIIKFKIFLIFLNFKDIFMTINAPVCLDTAVINYFKNGTSITIETEDLILNSIEETDLGFIQLLYTDPETMRLYADNEERLQKKSNNAWKAEQLKAAKELVDTFVKRWTVEKIPFSGFLIKHNQRSIGFIAPGFGNNPGQLEIVFAITSTQQHRGFGSQAVHAIVQRYIPALIENHYHIYGKPLEVNGNPVTEMRATTRWDNGASLRVQAKAGMCKVGKHGDQWGLIHDIYSITYTNPPLNNGYCLLF